MNATQEQIDRLARLFQAASTGDEDGWEDLYIASTTSALAETRDSLESFRLAAKQDWAEAEGREELEGAIYWERVQAHRGEPRTALIVVDCGEFRLSYRQ